MLIPHWSDIQTSAAKHGVPANYLAGLLAQESGFNPKAVGDKGQSFGMGQFNTRGALAEAGLTPQEMLAMSPAEQIDLAAWFYKKKLNQANGDPIKALERYNGGGDPNYTRNVQQRMVGLTLPVDPRMASTLPPTQADYSVPPQSLPGRPASGTTPPPDVNMVMPPMSLGDRMAQDPILQMGLGIMGAKQGTGSASGAVAEGISAGLRNTQLAELSNAQQAHQLLVNKSALQTASGDPAAIRTIQKLMEMGVPQDKAIGMAMGTGGLGVGQYVPSGERNPDGSDKYVVLQPSRNVYGPGPVVIGAPAGLPPPSVTKATPKGAADIKEAVVTAGDEAKIQSGAKGMLPGMQVHVAQALDVADELVRQSGLWWSVGVGRTVASSTNPAAANDFETMREHLDGILGRQAIKDVMNSGLGRILQSEYDAAKTAIANIGKAQTVEAFKNSVAEAKAWISVAGDKAAWVAEHGVDPKGAPNFGKSYLDYKAQYRQAYGSSGSEPAAAKSLPPPPSAAATLPPTAAPMQAPPSTGRGGVTVRRVGD